MHNDETINSQNPKSINQQLREGGKKSFSFPITSACEYRARFWNAFTRQQGNEEMPEKQGSVFQRSALRER